MSEESKFPSESSNRIIRPPRPRRLLIIGAGATASLILTLANRPALAAKSCNHSTWISWKAWHSFLEEMGPCTGDSPATWRANDASLWAPSWGISFTKTTSFTATFPAVTQNGWSRRGSANTLDAALAGNVVIRHGSNNTLPRDFPAQATAALLNINFYGDKYGTSSNAQTIAALKSEVAADLPDNYAAGLAAINGFIAKYAALNTA
jgi:hypothetical protein